MNDRRRSRPALLILIGAALPGFSTVPLHAQVAHGRLSDAATGEPISTAFVLLVSDEGMRVQGTLSSANGGFRLESVEPGRFRIRIERIGYESRVTPPFDLAEGQTREFHLRVNSAAIPLEGIVAEAGQRCTVRPTDGVRASTLWNEARKALDITSWTASERRATFHIIHYERVRDLHSDRILEERSRGRTVYGESPFYSASARELAELGYVQALGDGSHQYFGLDAENLLSDAFLDTHCFRISERSAEPGLVGLAFEPLPEQRVPDISGVLWLDRATAELRHLEFTYDRHLHRIDVPLAPFGGRVDFRRLDSGAWIVRRWWIRMPQVQNAIFGDEFSRAAGRSRIRIYEVGGEVDRGEEEQDGGDP